MNLQMKKPASDEEHDDDDCISENGRAVGAGETETAVPLLPAGDGHLVVEPHREEGQRSGENPTYEQGHKDAILIRPCIGGELPDNG